ncbi:transporter substrate-binding domain-containing protein [Roseateles oligotrophus]|uniref:Transporter substrate-binding domain-containing protein n=1 Tax=Roseateles oligotrophus TaxID=1769250 RepID=A0ABT2Y9Q8_9BURK|nr:transporter substrate-binding domain-containing protein [Roseateles oligotrophus]MCV2367034.1 transporter substrate-binding domain-containing protein [Roseateles oligotrophus]
MRLDLTLANHVAAFHPGLGACSSWRLAARSPLLMGLLELLKRLAPLGRLALLVVVCACPADGMAAAGNVKELRVIVPSLPTSAAAYANYFPQLLRLALEKTKASDGPYRIEFFKGLLSSPRQVLELKNNSGLIDLIWDGSDTQREADLLPIRISLLRQLNDYRVFLIRAEDQEKFQNLRGLDELRQFSAGSGVNWPSTAVLRANGLHGETSTVYENLFAMLAAKRFDYFPRGLHEAWSEQQAHADKGLAVESSIFLHYRVPVYFFVSRDRPELADRIERGLNIALKDGSLEALFLSIPSFRHGLAEIKANQRRIFELKLQ